jgi:hypothetical protein
MSLETMSLETMSLETMSLETMRLDIWLPEEETRDSKPGQNPPGEKRLWFVEGKRLAR